MNIRFATVFLISVLLYGSLYILPCVDQSRASDTLPMEKEALAIRMRISAMGSVEEAFAYILTGDIEEKKDFLEGIKFFDRCAERFQKIITSRDTNSAVAAERFSGLRRCHLAMSEAAMVIFEEFERKGSAGRDNLEKFEGAIDELDERLEKLIEDIFGKNDSLEMTLEVLRVRATVLAAVEESFAYIVLDDKSEKEDAIAQFDKAAKLISAVEASHCSDPESLSKVRSVAESLNKLSAERERMHGAFEAKGAKDLETIHEFELAIHRFEYAVDDIK